MTYPILVIALKLSSTFQIWQQQSKLLVAKQFLYSGIVTISIHVIPSLWADYKEINFLISLA